MSETTEQWSEEYAALVKIAQRANAALRMELPLAGFTTVDEVLEALVKVSDPIAQWLINTRDYPGKPAPRPIRLPRPIAYPDEGRTYWNGEPTEARKVRVIVGKSDRPTWWCAELEGQEREAIEVRYYGQPPFYLDNEDGSGWAKVTVGRGSPNWGHSGLPVARVLGEVRHA